jgi:hypothetical protein
VEKALLAQGYGSDGPTSLGGYSFYASRDVYVRKVLLRETACQQSEREFRMTNTNLYVSSDLAQFFSISFAGDFSHGDEKISAEARWPWN